MEGPASTATPGVLFWMPLMDPRYWIVYHWDWAARWWSVAGLSLLLLLESSSECHCLDPMYSILYHWDWAARWWCVVGPASTATLGVLFWMPLFGSEILSSVSLILGSKVVVCGLWRFQPLLLLLKTSFECHGMDCRGSRTCIIEIGQQGGGVCRVQPLLLLLESSSELHCLDPRYSDLYHWDWAARWWCMEGPASTASPGVLFWMLLLGSEVLNSVSLRLSSKVVVWGGSSLYCFFWSPLLNATAWIRGTQFCIIEIVQQGGGVGRVQPLLLLLESSFECHCLDPRYSTLYH